MITAKEARTLSLGKPMTEIEFDALIEGACQYHDDHVVIKKWKISESLFRKINSCGYHISDWDEELYRISW